MIIHWLLMWSVSNALFKVVIIAWSGYLQNFAPKYHRCTTDVYNRYFYEQILITVELPEKMKPVIQVKSNETEVNKQSEVGPKIGPGWNTTSTELPWENLV